MTNGILFDDLYREPLSPLPVASGPAEQRDKFEGDCKRLLEALRLRPLFNYELPKFAGLNPRARISDLRNAGFRIENRKCTSVDRKGVTVYILIEAE
jgi:hypothetical protein